MVKSELEGESEVKIEEETAKPEIKIEIEEVTPPPVIEEIKPEIEEVKVEETPLPVEEVKNTNVEWAQDEEPTTSKFITIREVLLIEKKYIRQCVM